jgi:predicted lipoprotein with Yx(FWY)xxD motif
MGGRRMRAALAAAMLAGTALVGGVALAEEQGVSAKDADGKPMWMRVFPNIGSVMPPAPDAPPTPPMVQLRRVPGGNAYADLDGHTLYIRDGEAAAQGGASRDWKPMAAAWTARGAGDWTVVTRTDGTRQWAWQGHPLYTHTGDNKPGDAFGEGKDNGAWHVAFSTREFHPENVAYTAVVPHTNIGPALVTKDGKTLYFLMHFLFEGRGNNRYNSPTPGPAGCTGACLEQWQPFVAPKDAKPQGEWGVATRDDGTPQWTFRGQPLYTYSGDKNPGDARGEGAAVIASGITAKIWLVASLNP